MNEHAHRSSDDVARAMARLGYTTTWLERGVITEAALFEQLERLNQEDPAWDDFDWHLRVESFSHYWISEPLTPERADTLLEIAEHEAATYSGEMLVWLLESNAGLTDEHFSRITRNPAIADSDRRVRTATLLRRYRLDGPSDAWFRDAIASNLVGIQRVAVDCPKVPDWVLDTLSTAATKDTVRNIAKDRLMRRRKRPEQGK